MEFEFKEVALSGIICAAGAIMFEMTELASGNVSYPPCVIAAAEMWIRVSCRGFYMIFGVDGAISMTKFNSRKAKLSGLQTKVKANPRSLA